MEIPSPLLCPQCHQTITPEEYFCPNCGKALQEKPPSTVWFAQVGIYALSVFLPPLGLWSAVRYIRSRDSLARRIGWIAVVLTIISLIASIWYFQILMQQLNEYLYSASSGLLGT